MPTVAIHIFHPLAVILKSNDTRLFVFLLRNVLANLGNTQSLGQDFVTADSVGLLADTVSSAPHLLPLL